VRALTNQAIFRTAAVPQIICWFSLHHTMNSIHVQSSWV